MKRRRDIAIFTVILLCVSLRLLVFVMVKPWVAEVEQSVVLKSDPIGYHNLAVTLLENHRFAYSATGDPDAKRTILYPLFIAFNYWIFGERPWAVMLSQIVLNTLSCIILFFAIYRIFGRRIAIISAFLFAVDPNTIFFNTTLYTETLFLFLLSITLYIYSVIFISDSQGKILYYYGLLGVSIGLAALVRPIAKFIPLVIAIFILLKYRKEILKAVKYIIILYAAFLLAITPWLYRNYVNFKSASLSTVGADNVLLYNVAYMELGKRHQDITTIKKDLWVEAEKMMVADGNRTDQTNPFEKAKYLKRLAWGYIKADPISFTKIYCLGLFNSLFSVGSSFQAKMLGCSSTKVEIKAHSGLFSSIKTFIKEKGFCELLLAGIGFILLFIYYIGFLIGLWVLRDEFYKGFLIFGLFIAAYFALAGAIDGWSRFRLPCMPFTLALVGIGLNHIYEQICSKLSRVRV